MSAPSASSPTLCIALHDVAPATWPACKRLLAMIDALGAPPVTLLVVPDFHQRGRIDKNRDFVGTIDARIARGDEVALHGYFHVDAAPPPRGAGEWLRRRLLTAGEGEFAALDELEAASRIARGLELFAQLGWHADGFVAPAWLLGAGARRALAQTRLRYTSTHAQIEILNDGVLDGGRRIDAPCLTASSRSAWRRGLSRAWLLSASAALSQRRHLRVALHPGDAEHPAMVAAWLALLIRLLSTREALTKAALMARADAARAGSMLVTA